MIFDIKLLCCDVCKKEVVGALIEGTHGNIKVRPLLTERTENAFTARHVGLSGPAVTWRQKLDGTTLCPNCSEVTHE